MSKTFDRLLIVAVAAATLVIVPNVLRFERTHEDWSEENATALAEMSRSGREDLKANAKRLQTKLSDEKRDAVRAIHEAVGEPETAKKLESYHAWLQELDIVERDSIRSAGSTVKKVTRIQNLISDEEQRSQGFTVDLDDRRIKRFRGEEFVRQLQVDMEAAGVTQLWISDREYDAMLATIVGGYPKRIQSGFNRAVAEIEPSASEAERHRLRSNALGAALMQWMERERSPAPFDHEYVDKVLDAIEESSTREPLKKLSDEQKSTLVGVMRYRCLNRSRFLADYFPQDAEVERFFADLPRPEQIQLMSMDASSMRGRLNLLYVARKENVPDDIRDVAESMLQWMDRRAKEPGGRRGTGRRGGPRGGGRRPRNERERSNSGPPKGSPAGQRP